MWLAHQPEAYRRGANHPVGRVVDGREALAAGAGEPNDAAVVEGVGVVEVSCDEADGPAQPM